MPPAPPTGTTATPAAFAICQPASVAVCIACAALPPRLKMLVIPDSNRSNPLFMIAPSPPCPDANPAMPCWPPSPSIWPSQFCSGRTNDALSMIATTSDTPRRNASLMLDHMSFTPLKPRPTKSPMAWAMRWKA